MEAAEQLVEQCPIDVRLIDMLLKCKHASAGNREMLVALDEVVVEECGDVERARIGRVGRWFGHAGRFNSWRACSVNAAGSNGLVRYKFAPASNTAVRLSSSPRVVRTMIGISRKAACFRTKCTTSSPCTSGMFRSRTIRSALASASRSIASNPFAASEKTTPEMPRNEAATMRRIVAESSTIRIFEATWAMLNYGPSRPHVVGGQQFASIKGHESKSLSNDST